MSVRMRIFLAFLTPFVAGGVQWWLWDAFIKPYVWFLFFPAAFFSAWLGGLLGGLIGTAISALVVWYVFMPPQLSFALASPSSVASIASFVVMGGLFAWFFERLQRAMRTSEAARRSAEQSKEEISRLYRKTLELDELKSQFFANVSHELRTPLTLIMAPLEQRLATGDLKGTERAETEVMLRNARLLYRQVSDLLDAAKLEAGGMQPLYARIDLAELTRAMASHFDSVARERRIAYRVDVPDALSVEADGEKVQRILLNLLSNAFKFTPDGGRVEVKAFADGPDAVIEVEDNGPGIPADLREAVFERFRQLEGRATRRHGGTGLGLAIVREFAQLHGGSAALRETPGGGALFSVRLPLKAPPGTVLALPNPADAATVVGELAGHWPAVPHADAETSPPNGRDLPLILVVEDNADMQAFIADSLKSSYRVARAVDGGNGLTQALALLPDLIVTDVMMPVMSGDTLVTELRRQPQLAEVPIVVLTARADDDLRVRLLQAGVQDYLTKPFRVDELRARIDGLIGERQRAGSRLKESQNRFEATFEQAAVGIALAAPDGHWLRVNGKFCDIVGYTQDELLNLCFQDITHPDDLAADLDLRFEMLAGRVVSSSLIKRYLRKDGNIVWVNLSVALVCKADGNPDYFIAVVEDISQRKYAEAQLELWREAFDKSELGVAISIYATQRLLSVNPAFARRRGYAVEELVGMPVIRLFPENCWDVVNTRLAEIDRQGHGSLETEHRCKNGERFPVLLDVTTLRSADGHPLNRIVYALDISERAQAERALRQQTEELRLRNAELERFDSAGIDRELAMIRLKREVNELARELDRAAPYDVSFAGETDQPPGQWS